MVKGPGAKETPVPEDTTLAPEVEDKHAREEGKPTDAHAASEIKAMPAKRKSPTAKVAAKPPPGKTQKVAAKSPARRQAACWQTGGRGGGRGTCPLSGRQHGDGVALAQRQSANLGARPTGVRLA